MVQRQNRERAGKKSGLSFLPQLFVLKTKRRGRIGKGER